jgi:hypothetical protein
VHRRCIAREFTLRSQLIGLDRGAPKSAEACPSARASARANRATAQPRTGHASCPQTLRCATTQEPAELADGLALSALRRTSTAIRPGDQKRSLWVPRSPGTDGPATRLDMLAREALTPVSGTRLVIPDHNAPREPEVQRRDRFRSEQLNRLIQVTYAPPSLRFADHCLHERLVDPRGADHATGRRTRLTGETNAHWAAICAARRGSAPSSACALVPGSQRLDRLCNPVVAVAVRLVLSTRWEVSRSLAQSQGSGRRRCGRDSWFAAEAAIRPLGPQTAGVGQHQPHAFRAGAAPVRPRTPIAGSEARTEVCRTAALPTQRRSASTERRFRIDPRWLELVTIEMAKPLVRTRGGRSARAVVQGADLAQAAEQLSRGQRNREGWTQPTAKAIAPCQAAVAAAAAAAAAGEDQPSCGRQAGSARAGVWG